MTNFATAVRRVKLPPPRLGPNAVASTEAVTLHAQIPSAPPPPRRTAAPPPWTTTKTVPEIPPATAPQPAIGSVAVASFPRAIDVDTTDLNSIEQEIVRILSGCSASIGRIAANLSVVLSADDASSLIRGLSAKGKVVAFVAEKRRTHYRLRSATENLCDVRADSRRKLTVWV